MHKLSFLLVFILFGEFCYGQLHVWDSVPISVNENLSNTRPRITIAQNETPVIMWGDLSSSNGYFSLATNGIDFSEAQLFHQENDIFYADWAGPEFATDGASIYFIYKPKPENQQPVVMARYQLQSESIDYTVVADIDNHITRFPNLEVGQNGVIYGVFMLNNTDWSEPNYVLTKALDFESPFSDYTPVHYGIAAGEACDCCPAELLIDDNVIISTFRNNINNLRNMWFGYSDNYGEEFSIVERVDTTNSVITFCPSSGPSSILTDEKIITVWKDYSAMNMGIMVSVYDLIDQQIMYHFSISNEPANNANFPRISGQGNNIAIVWQDKEDGQNVIKTLVTEDGIEGLPFASVEIISDTSLHCTYPDITYKDGTLHCVYENDISGIAYQTLSLETNTSIGNNIEAQDVLVIQQPELLQVQSRQQENIVKNCKLVALDGTTVYDKQNIHKAVHEIPLSYIGAGYYVLFVAFKDGYATKNVVIY